MKDKDMNGNGQHRTMAGLKAALLAGLCAMAVADARAVVVESGAEIVVPSGKGGVARALREGAETLVRVWRESTGGDLRIVAPDARTPGRQAILLGGAAAAKAGFDLTGLSGMQNVIAEKNGDVYLFGNDRPSRADATLWWRCLLPSVRALTRFMEGRMDVRFLMPGDVGIDAPRVARVELPDGTYDLEKPQLEIGNGRFHGMMYDIANNIFGSTTCFTYGGHTFPSACPVEKYYDAHPEYFALRAGKRVGVKGNPALCISNPAVEDLVVEEILRRFDEGYDIVELGQNDGLDYCTCDACAALGQGLGFGEQFWVFHSRVARRLYALRPEKRVLITAYSVTDTPPKTVRDLTPNVMLEIMKYSQENLDQWKAFGAPCGFTTYIYNWGGWSMTGLTAKRSYAFLADQARRFIANGVRGIYRCGYGELFGTEGPAYYVYNRILGDPSLDANRLADEYVRRAYGAAAQPMGSFFRTLDKRLDLIAIDTFRRQPLNLLSALYPPDVLEQMENFLSAGEKLARTEKERQRLALTRLEFDYLRHLVEVCHLYNAYRLRPTQALFDPMADAILARNAFIDSLYDEKGKMRRLPGWADVPVLGAFTKSVTMQNGSLGARVGSPFLWNIPFLREKGVLPGAQTKTMEIARAATRPTLADFKADGGAWSAAAWLPAFGGIQLQAVASRTRVKALYDADNLYFAFETTLPDDVTPDPVGRDGSPWWQDCLEALVDPTGFGGRWYHMIWNATPNSFADLAVGVVDDPLDPKFGHQDKSWDGQGTYENDRANGIWRSLLTIPFATLGAATPAAGEVWKVNLAREAWSKSADGKDKRHEIAVWSPNLTGGAIPDPTAFGKAVFK